MATTDSTGKKEYGMSQAHRDVLRKKHTYLLSNMELSEDFFGFLIEDGILSDSHIEEIEAEKTKKKRIQLFLRNLTRKGPKAFELFIKALVKSQQEFVADALDENLANKYKEGGEDENPPSQPRQEAGGGDSRSQPVIGGTSAPTIKPSEYIAGDFIPVSVKSIDTTDAFAKTMNSLAQDTENVYQMSSKPRGRAIIINQHTFTGEFRKLSDRAGTDIDATHMDQLLEGLDYETDTWRNVTAEEMMEKVRKESSNKAHEKYDSFIMVILTHGAQGKVYGTDGQAVAINEIVEEFNARRCPYLRGKPKMFFIQACQGDMKPVGVEVSDASSEQPSKPEELSEDMRRLTVGDSKETMYDIRKTPEMADILVAYATVPGYVSWRKEESGTWFIRVVVQVFMEQAHKDHVADMLTKVARVISQLQTKGSGFVQLSETRTTLLKKVYFFPGLDQH